MKLIFGTLSVLGTFKMFWEIQHYPVNGEQGIRIPEKTRALKLEMTHKVQVNTSTKKIYNKVEHF